MNYQDFISELEGLTDQIKILIDAEMERKGDTAAECQFVCVFDKVSDLEHAISGIESKDMRN